MKKKILSLMLTACFAVSAQAQTDKAVTELPDVSVVGNFLATQTDDETNFDVKEIEISFQHYLYPTVKANIFTALHKEESGERNFELEEAYVNFSDLLSVLAPNGDTDIPLGAIVGKKLLNVGKTNATHPEEWAFVDRALVIKQFFGEEEGLSAEGGSFQYLLPVPFFSQLDLGFWTAVAAHAHDEGEEEEEEEGHGVEYENRIFNARLWNSVPVAGDKEVEVGLNYLLGNATADESDDQQQILGLDLTYVHELDNEQSITFQSEIFSAEYGEEGEERESQTGSYVSAKYRISPQYEAGLRYGTLGKHGDEGDDQNQLSFLFSKNLTETSKFRLQYNTGDNVENTVLAQFIFGMGPHSHVLQ